MPVFLYQKYVFLTMKTGRTNICIVYDLPMAAARILSFIIMILSIFSKKNIVHFFNSISKP